MKTLNQELDLDDEFGPGSAERWADFDTGCEITQYVLKRMVDGRGFHKHFAEYDGPAASAIHMAIDVTRYYPNAEPRDVKAAIAAALRIQAVRWQFGVRWANSEIKKFTESRTEDLDIDCMIEHVAAKIGNVRLQEIREGFPGDDIKALATY